MPWTLGEVLLQSEASPSWHQRVRVKYNATGRHVYFQNKIFFWLPWQVLFQHKLSAISFASSGEADMVDFVSYVAKATSPEDTATGEKSNGVVETAQTTNGHSGGGRKCYVFFCNGGCSRDFITSVGEAFKMGYRVSPQSWLCSVYTGHAEVMFKKSPLIRQTLKLISRFGQKTLG